MTPDLLREAGEALYGARWQSPLAMALDVNLRTMQRWAAGSKPPDSIVPELRALLGERGKVVAGLIKRL